MEQQACDPADRLCRDTAEFEGGSPPAGTAAHQTWEPSLTELALAAIVPLLLLVLLSHVRWCHGGRRGGSPVAGVAALRSRCLSAVSHHPPTQGSLPPASAAAAGGMQREARWQSPAAARAALLPLHPVAAGQAGASSRSGTTSSLMAAIDATVGLLLLPLSMLQYGLHLAGLGGGLHDNSRGDAAADPHTPGVAAAISGSARPSSAKRYGMGYGEAESEEEEWPEGRASELTEEALRHLSETPEFHAFLKARGLTPVDVGTSISRVRLYRRLRRLDPPAFWRLLRPGSRTVFQSRAPSRLLLAADYLLSTTANLAAAAAVGYLYLAAPALPASIRAAGAAAAVWMVVVPWMRAQTTAGALFGLWYEEPHWGHAAPGWRCMAASLLELVYVSGSAGTGTAVSLWLRCVSRRRQSVGELLVGVHAVQEVQLAEPGEED